MQRRPAVQATQLPCASQTRFAPQLVPAISVRVLSVHVVELPHESRPRLHGLGLPTQVLLGTQAPQKPALSQVPLGQVAPLLFGYVSAQVGEPVVHDMAPLKQGRGLLVQLCPLTHEVHAPEALQTRLVPQLVPGVAGAASMQVCTPPLHDVTPTLQGAPGLLVHALPLTQPRHWPLPLHTPPSHAQPAGALMPSLQLVAAAHTVLPSLHGVVGLVVHAAPGAQVLQLPAMQTCPVPQLMPSVAAGPSTHCAVPVAHEITPVLQGAAGLVLHV